MTGSIGAPTGTARRYRVVEGFARRPPDLPFVEVADVDLDTSDNLYVFSRGAHPVMVFDRDGALVRHWGAGAFTTPHGLTVAPDGTILTADTGDHTVRRWSPDGELLMTLGRPNAPAPAYGGEPFNRPTKAAVASNGDIYVSDGYANARVHVFDPSGAHRFSWGRRGNSVGEFDLPHGIFVDRDDGDRVYVADRYNDRVQVFGPRGEPIAQWGELVMPNNVRRAPDGTYAVAELANRVSILDREGTVIARFGHEGARLDDSEAAAAALPSSPAYGRRGKVRNEPGAGRCCAPHGIAVDSRGALFVAEVAQSWVGLDRGDRALQKFEPLLTRTPSRRRGAPADGT